MAPRDAHLPEPVSIPHPARRAAPRPQTTSVPRAAPSPRPASLSSSPDLPALLRALQRRWLLALGLSLLLVPAAGVGAWVLMSPRYTAFAQLHIASVQPGLLAHNAEENRNFAVYQKTQATKLKNRTILVNALAEDKVKRLPLVRQQADMLTFLEEEMRVEFQEGNEIMTVLLSGTAPDDLVTLVDAVTKAYENQVVTADHAQRSERAQKLEETYNKKDDELRKDREKLGKLAEKLETSDPQVLSQKQYGLIFDLTQARTLHQSKRRELMEAQTRVLGQKARAEAQARVNAATPPPAPAATPDKGEPPLTVKTLPEALEIDKTYKERLDRAVRLRERVRIYSRSFTHADEPSLVRARDNLHDAEESLEARKAEVQTELVRLAKELKERELKAAAPPPKAPSLPSLPGVEIDPDLAQYQAVLASLQGEEKELARQVDVLETKAKMIGTSPTELSMLREKIASEHKLAGEIWAEKERLQAELGAGPRVTIHQPAGLQKKDMKRQVMAAGLAPLLVLAGVGFGVAWLEFRARRIRTAEEVATGLGIRVVGSVPRLTRGATPGGQEGAVESIDAIRTLLLRDDATRVVMVTSAVAGEAKTTLASSLADSLARAGRKTLLVDGDLRSPAAHQLFEAPLQPGFSEILLGEIDAVDAIQATPVPGLWLISAGQWDREVVQALARAGTQEIFEKLKQDYDYIVVDSHPVLAATDSLLLGQHVDAVLLSILRDVSRSPHVYTASQRLATLGIPTLGAVVNGAAADDVYAPGCPEPVPAAR